MSDPRNERENEPRHPGMMGDGTEEQSLGQRGRPKSRISEEEVDRAFGGELSADEYEDADLEAPDSEFWRGFAWGAASTVLAVCLLRRRN